MVLPESFIAAYIVIVAIALLVLFLLWRGVRMRIVAWAWAAVVFVALYILPWGESRWLVLCMCGFGAACAYLGLRSYYRLVKSSGQFPNLRW